MWLNKVFKKKAGTKKLPANDWLPQPSWIEDWVKQMIARDKHFFYRRSLILERDLPFHDPIEYTIELSRKIVKNLGLPSKNIVASFSGVHSAGRIEHRTGEPYFIEISSHWKHDRTAIAAIIAHEMSHAWMDDQGIRQNNKDFNEMLTDVTAVLLGLGVLLMNGLSVEKTVSQSQTSRQILRIKNYIEGKDMGYTLSIFMKHKNLEPNQVLPALYSNARSAFELGQEEFIKRQNLIYNSRQIENWVVICPMCFQKMRLPNIKKNIILDCPNCKKKTRYVCAR